MENRKRRYAIVVDDVCPSWAAGLGFVVTLYHRASSADDSPLPSGLSASRDVCCRTSCAILTQSRADSPWEATFLRLPASPSTIRVGHCSELDTTTEPQLPVVVPVGLSSG